MMNMITKKLFIFSVSFFTILLFCLSIIKGKYSEENDNIDNFIKNVL